MIRKGMQYAWSVRHQFAKYFIVGISGFVLDMGTLVLFKRFFGITPVLAVVINQIILIAYNFNLNKYWSFRNRAMPHKQFVRYVMLAGFNYGLSVLTMYIFNTHIGFDYKLVRIATIALMVSWNFFLYKYWVYCEGSGKREGGSDSSSAKATEDKGTPCV